MHGREIVGRQRSGWHNSAHPKLLLPPQNPFNAAWVDSVAANNAKAAPNRENHFIVQSLLL